MPIFHSDIHVSTTPWFQFSITVPLFVFLLASVGVLGDFRVNRLTESSQQDPVVATLSSGSQFVIAWRSSPYPYNVMAQLYSSNGTRVGPQIVVTTSDVAAWEHCVAGLTNDRFVVVWKLQGSTVLVAQIHDQNGGILVPEFSVTTGSTVEEPRVAGLKDGGFVVTWACVLYIDLNEVCARRFDSDGSAKGSKWMVNIRTDSSQDYPTVTDLADEEYIISWSSFGGDQSSYGVLAAIYDYNNDTKVQDDFVVNDHTSYDQARSSVALLSNDNFVITWSSYKQDTLDSNGVFAQLFFADGSRYGAEFGVTTTVEHNQFFSSVYGLTNGSFVIVWQSNQIDVEYYDIFGQLFCSDGSRQGIEFPVNSFLNNTQEWPVVSSFSDGHRFVVSWESYQQDGSSWGVYAQLFESNGVPLYGPVSSFPSSIDDSQELSSDVSSNSHDESDDGDSIVSISHISDGSENLFISHSDESGSGDSIVSISHISDGSENLFISHSDESGSGDSIVSISHVSDGSESLSVPHFASIASTEGFLLHLFAGLFFSFF